MLHMRHTLNYNSLRSLPNDNVKFSNLRFFKTLNLLWLKPQRELTTINLSFSTFTSMALLPVQFPVCSVNNKGLGEEAIIAK